MLRLREKCHGSSSFLRPSATAAEGCRLDAAPALERCHHSRLRVHARRRVARCIALEAHIVQSSVLDRSWRRGRRKRPDGSDCGRWRRRGCERWGRTGRRRRRRPRFYIRCWLRFYGRHNGRRTWRRPRFHGRRFDTPFDVFVRWPQACQRRATQR
jgi:hypothetical protein